MRITKEVSLFARWSLPKLWKQKGFSMTEVMVGGAILAGVALSGARMFKDQTMAQKRVDLDAQLNTFHSSLTKVLQNEKNCNATMNPYYNLNPASVGSPSAIYLCSGCSSTSIDYNANPTISPRTASPFIQPGDWIENTSGQTTKQTGTWILSVIQMSTPSGTGMATFKIKYTMNPNLPGGGRGVWKTIGVGMRFSQTTPPLFQECISGIESSVNNLQNDICSSMPAVSSTGIVMEWDDVTQKCKTIGSVASPLKTCPSGTFIEGVKSDGSVHCRSVGQGLVPEEDLMLSSPCAPGTSVKLEIVDGKLKTTCI